MKNAKNPEMVTFHHHLPGRMRIRIESLEKNRLLANHLASATKHSPLVKSVHFNTRTGRALIHYNPGHNNPQEIIKCLSGLISRYYGADESGTGKQFSEKNNVSAVMSEPEDLPVKRQVFNAALGGITLAAFYYRRITGRTSYLADSPGLFNTAAVITIITGYPMFKSGIASLAQQHRINHDALLSALSLILILLRESIPGLTVVWLAGIISLIETLVLNATVGLAGNIARDQYTGVNGHQLQNTGAQPPDKDFVASHSLTAAARTYGERISTTALWLAALSGLKDRDPVKSLAILLASSPGAAGQAFPSSMAGSVALAAKHGILARNRQSLAKAAGIKTVIFTHSSMLAPDFSPGSVLPAAGRSLSDCLSISKALAEHSRFYAGLFEKAGSGNDEGSRPATDYAVTVQTDTPAGIGGTINGVEAFLGSREFIEQAGIAISPAEYKVRRLSRFYQAPVFVAYDGSLAGVIGVRRLVPDRWRESLNLLKAAGVSPVLITEEKIENVMPLQMQTGIEVIAEAPLPLMPEITRAINQNRGFAAVVGANPEDAPALKAADLSLIFPGDDGRLIPLGDIHFKTKDPAKIYEAIIIGKRCTERARQNLLLVAAFNLFGLAAATAGRLTPTGAAVFNNLAGIMVAVNSLRLIGVKR